MREELDSLQRRLDDALSELEAERDDSESRAHLEDKLNTKVEGLEASLK